LIEGEYRIIRRHIKAFRVKPALNKTVKTLKTQIDEDPKLSAELDVYAQKDTSSAVPTAASTVVTAYLIVSLVLTTKGMMTLQN
jgi:hypothetical protein